MLVFIYWAVFKIYSALYPCCKYSTWCFVVWCRLIIFTIFLVLCWSEFMSSFYILHCAQDLQHLVFLLWVSFSYKQKFTISSYYMLCYVLRTSWLIGGVNIRLYRIRTSPSSLEQVIDPSGKFMKQRHDHCFVTDKKETGQGLQLCVALIVSCLNSRIQPTSCSI